MSGTEYSVTQCHIPQEGILAQSDLSYCHSRYVLYDISISELKLQVSSDHTHRAINKWRED